MGLRLIHMVHFVLIATAIPLSKKSVVQDSIEVFTIRVSVRLSDRSKVTQNKINFVQNWTQWGLNSLQICQII